jgi:hypothetical protein
MNPVPQAPAARLQPRRHRTFRRRLLAAVGLSACLIGASLSIGVAGYHFIARLGLVDSILNASMILAGMGPVETMTTVPAKLFASAYALFSGVVFISATGILLTPVFHRVLHRFHLEERDRG